MRMPTIAEMGPYWIECDLVLGVPTNCCVVDFRRPLGGAGEGFESVFIGTYAECEAWLEGHS